MIAPLDAGDILQNAFVAHQGNHLVHLTLSQIAVQNFNLLQLGQTQNLKLATKSLCKSQCQCGFPIYIKFVSCLPEVLILVSYTIKHVCYKYQFIYNKIYVSPHILDFRCFMDNLYTFLCEQNSQIWVLRNSLTMCNT
jgi:hypothetical protein